MKVELLGHTQLTQKKADELKEVLELGVEQGKLVAFTAIRNCYSATLPSEIVAAEGNRYLTKKASDGGSGNDMDRLIRHIMNSGHTSTMEHINFVFTVEGPSRALLAQLTRHRVGWGYSVESQRYVNYKSDGKSGGFKYVVPNAILASDKQVEWTDFDGHVVVETPFEIFEQTMNKLQEVYDVLVNKAKIKAEDARAILPQATECNIVVSCNARAFLDLYSKRKPGTHAQGEIQELVELMKNEIVAVEPWLGGFFI